MSRGGTGGTPRPEIHCIERAGMEMYREKIRVQSEGRVHRPRGRGEMIIASGDTLYSYDLDLNTLQGLVYGYKSDEMTVEGGSTDAYFATAPKGAAKKWVHNKGMKDNWATDKVAAA